MTRTSTSLRMFAVVVGFTVFLVAFVSARVAAGAEKGVAAQYDAAKQAYNDGRYKEVVSLLKPLLYPENRLTSADQLVSAHKMLGISYVFEKNQTAAEQSFLAILSERPNYELNQLIDPASAVALFEKVKQRNVKIIRRIEARKQREAQIRRELEAKKQRERQTRQNVAPIVVEKEVVKRELWVAMVPFGTGQFQNGHKTKGYVLLATQALLGAASLGSALAFRVAFPHSTPAPEQLNLARALNTTKVVTGALFWTTVLYGIADAIIYFGRPSGESAGDTTDSGPVNRQGGTPENVSSGFSFGVTGVNFNATF